MLAGLALPSSCGTALSDDMIGQASIVDGTPWKSTATAFDSGVSTRPRARNSAEATTAISTDVARRQPTTSTRGGQRTAIRSISTVTDAWSQSARLVVPILANVATFAPAQ